MNTFPVDCLHVNDPVRAPCILRGALITPYYLMGVRQEGAGGRQELDIDNVLQSSRLITTLSLAYVGFLTDK